MWLLSLLFRAKDKEEKDKIEDEEYISLLEEEEES